MASSPPCSPTNSRITSWATARLDAAGCKGAFGNFGRNATRIRETEVEADRLSVYLLERAGYDPRGGGPLLDPLRPRGLNFLGSPTHPNWRRRIASFEAEIALIRAARAAGRTPMPAFLSAAAPAAAAP
jgi:predicted Zn-dependent protease